MSVVVQSYQYARYLRECLDSVLDQTYDHYELIVIDDGSTDGSAAIIRDYAAAHPHKVRAILRPDNRGVSRTYNESLDAMRGSVYVGLSSDDVLPPDALERKVDHLVAHPDIDVLASDFDVIDAEGEIHQGDAKLALVPQFRTFFDVGLERLTLQLVGGNFLPDPAMTVVLGRLTLDDLRYDERCPLLADWELWLRLSEGSAWDVLPASTVRYRWHGRNLSAWAGSPDMQDRLDIERIYILAKALTRMKDPDARDAALRRISNISRRQVRGGGAEAVQPRPPARRLPTDPSDAERAST